MPAKYFEFEDGQRLPGDRVKEFLMNQAVIQCANQSEITLSGIEEFGARVAINLEDGQLWTYTPDIEAWAPAQNTLDLELLDARYYTKIAANGIFISETTADARYLTEVTARGIFLTQTDTDARYYTKLQADGLYLTETSADGRYYTKLQADGLYLGKQEAGTTYVTKLDAGSLYIAKTDNAGTYVTSISGDKITTGSIDANLITSGELVGRTIRTVPAGNTAKRIIVNTSGEIVFFNSGSTSEAGRIEATAAGISINGAGGGNLAVSGTPIISWSGSGISLLQNTTQTGSLSATGTVSSNGGFSAGTGTTIGASVSTNGGILANGNLTINGTSTLDGTVTSSSLITGTNFRGTTLTGSTTVAAGLNANGFLQRGTSSERYKQDIENLQINYNDVINMQPKTFRRIEEVEEFGENAATYPGFIAEDLAGTSLDPFVFYSEDENGNPRPEGIHYAELTAALVSVIKEQDTKLNALEARIAALEGGAQ